MDDAQDPGPAKKPTPRTNSRPTGNRKPPPVRKPAARKPAAPKAPATQDDAAAAPAVEQVEVPAAPLEFEATVLVPRDAELVVEPEPGEDEPDEVAAATPEPEADGVAPDEVEVAEAEAEHSEPVEPEVASGAAAGSGGAALGARLAAWFRRAGGASTASKQPANEIVPKADHEIFAPLEVTSGSDIALAVSGLTKRFDDNVAVDGINLTVKVGAFYGIVGPNGAGKTTTLSMITGLLRPDSGTVVVGGSNVWTDTVQAKRMMGVLPDRLRLFDRLTGGQLLYYAGVLRGLDGRVVRERTTDLAHAFGLEESLGRLVSDYSAGMTKKIALAAAMIHSPRVLVLDEPFESVDPVSAATVTEILKKYVAAGGTVVLSSHSMDLVQRICDHVAVVVRGEIIADGTVAEVRGDQSLEERFVELAGGRTTVEGLEWLHTFSD